MSAALSGEETGVGSSYLQAGFPIVSVNLAESGVFTGFRRED